MLRKPPYTECRIYYDGGSIAEGHYLVTPAGSAYLITKITQHRTRSYRKNLVCLRWPLDEIPIDAHVRSLIWYPRAKRKARSLRDHQLARDARTNDQSVADDD